MPHAIFNFDTLIKDMSICALSALVCEEECKKIKSLGISFVFISKP